MLTGGKYNQAGAVSSPLGRRAVGFVFQATVTCLVSQTQVGLADHLVLQQFLALALSDDAPRG